LNIAAPAERAGALLESNAAIAAATWLDPAAENRAQAIRRSRTGLLATVLADEPIRKTPTHSDAWSWKLSSGSHLPSLLAHEHIESFSVRTRIYRSLGQVPHQAAAATLREALDDPHPFARAQAARSLGWLCDPIAVERLQGLREDKDPEVRRTAKLAVERIVGYWTLFGEWRPTLLVAVRHVAAIEQLADLGLRAFAYELIRRLPTETARPLQKRLARYSLHGKPRPEREYHFHFAADAAERSRIAATDPHASGPAMLRLFAISAHRATDCLAFAAERVREDGPVGWNARRVFRALGIGRPDQRCREEASSRCIEPF
jgi:hypothetical protein